MSNLTAIEYIQERSEATPGLWNQRFSTISANLAAVNSDVTLFLPSGDTFSLLSHLTVGGRVSVKERLHVGSTPSDSTLAQVVIGASSGQSDYILFTDTSDARSDYLLGSRVGGTADGLNLWDVSGNTMIASFSKQSVRFYQNVVGPVFDVGGALASTYNAATFGTGADSKESRIQSAIDQAATDGFARVYVPASMYPYSAGSITFNTAVQMVREGGNWGVFDVQAYGAGVGGVNATQSARGAIAGADRIHGTVVFPSNGSFTITSSLTLPRFGTIDGSGAEIYYSGAGFLFDVGATEVLSKIHIRNLEIICQSGSSGWLRVGRSTETYSESLNREYWSIRDVNASAIPSGTTNSLGMSVTQIHSCVIDNLTIDGFERPLIWDRNAKCQVNRLRCKSYTKASVFSAGAQPLTGNVFITPDFLPNGGDYGVEIDHQGITFIGALYEEAASGGSALLHITRNGEGFCDIDGLFASSVADMPKYAIYIENSNAYISFIRSRFVSSMTSVSIGTVGGTEARATFLQCSPLLNTQVSLNTAANYRLQGDLNFHRDIVLHADGTAVAPSVGFLSEASLGWWRSAASTIKLSYGTLEVPGNLNMTTPSTNQILLGGLVITQATIRHDLGGLAIGSELIGTANIILDYPSAGQLQVRRAGNAANWIWAADGLLGIPDGSAQTAPIHFSSESSLGWYRSGVSTMALSYGQLSLFSGSNTTPGIGFSDTSLGFYKSGAQTIAASQGTLNLATNAVRLSMRTLASLDSTNVAVNEVVFGIRTGVLDASQLAIRSGGTIYYFDSSSSTKG